MLILDCEGSPYEIGLQHGEKARQQIKRSIAFYAQLFETTSDLGWDSVQDITKPYASVIQQKWPSFYEEMRGVADGSESSILEIVALNIRTEIAFGRFSDGCTSLAWHTENASFLSQNWDWKEAQKENLIILKIKQTGKPSIQMVTEAGLIGKIGLNSMGVGVCLNAIKAKGTDPTRIPVHLALRLALECNSASDAVQQLVTYGVAASAHILIADPQNAYGLEVSSTTTEVLRSDARGRLIHANHFRADHKGVTDARLLDDSEAREQRMSKITDSVKQPSWEQIFHAFQDEDDAPTSICRQEVGTSTLATLFNIIMDLRSRRAEVCLGRPTRVEQRISLAFST